MTSKPSVLERGKGRPVALTTDHEPVDPVHAVLLAGELGVVGPDVLDEQETATWSQDPAQLPQTRPRLVVHAT